MSTRDFSASPTAHPEIGIPRRILSVRRKDGFNLEIIVIIIIIAPICDTHFYKAVGEGLSIV